MNELQRQDAMRCYAHGEHVSSIAARYNVRPSTIMRLMGNRGVRYNSGVLPCGQTPQSEPTFPVEMILRHAYEREDAARKAEAERRAQTIPPYEKAAGIALLSDIHFGGCTAYREVFSTAERIRDAGCGAILLGDYCNNWRAVSKLAHLQADEWMPDADAKALYRHWVSILAGNVVAALAGNHDAWSQRMGEDYVRDALAGIRCLYNPQEIRFTLTVGDAAKEVVCRHKFKGRSKYNPTHGIEQACRDGRRFDIGIQGDTHTATLARPFCVGDEIVRLAFLVSTFKFADPFPVQLGLPPTQGTGSAFLIVEPSGAMHGYSELEDGLRHWERLVKD